MARNIRTGASSLSLCLLALSQLMALVTLFLLSPTHLSSPEKIRVEPSGYYQSEPSTTNCFVFALVVSVENKDEIRWAE